MENIIFDKWIEIDNSHLGFLKIARKKNIENMIILLLIKDTSSQSCDNIKTIQLKVNGRTVTSENGTTIDFGTAYPFATPNGKITITKQFIKVFMN